MAQIQLQANQVTENQQKPTPHQINPFTNTATHIPPQ